MRNKIIILLGQRERSGTNFIASTITQHPDVVTVPPHMSIGEFNLFRDDDIIQLVFRKVARTSFGLRSLKNDETLFLKYYGEMWLNVLNAKYNFPIEKTIFIKSPLINNVHLWRAAFPDSKIAVLYRDGRDNVVSCVRSSNDTRDSFSFQKKMKNKINFHSGRSFVSNSKAWVKTGLVVTDIQENEFLKKIKYERLLDSQKNIKELLKFYDLRNNEAIIEQCINAPVVGSSSLRIKNVGSAKQHNWKPDHNKSKYKFINKWSKWGPIKKTVFKILASDVLIKLGYEKDKSW